MLLEITILIGIIFIASIALLIFLKSNRIRKKHQNIVGALKEYAMSNFIKEYRIERVFNNQFDYIYDINNKIYLIKIIDNYNNNEIVVNSRSKWQVTTPGENLKFISDIEGFILKDYSNIYDKDVIKICLIYPSAVNLMKYINECEMVFIYPYTDVHGVRVLKYNGFKEQFTQMNIER